MLASCAEYNAAKHGKPEALEAVPSNQLEQPTCHLNIKETGL